MSFILYVVFGFHVLVGQKYCYFLAVIDWILLGVITQCHMVLITSFSGLLQVVVFFF